MFTLPLGSDINGVFLKMMTCLQLDCVLLITTLWAWLFSQGGVAFAPFKPQEPLVVDMTSE